MLKITALIFVLIGALSCKHQPPISKAPKRASAIAPQQPTVEENARSPKGIESDVVASDVSDKRAAAANSPVEECNYVERKAIAFLPRDVAKRYCKACRLDTDWDVCKPASLKTQNRRHQKLRKKFKLSCEEMSILTTIIEMSYGKQPSEKTYYDRLVSRWYRALPGLSQLAQQYPAYRIKSLPKASREFLQWLGKHQRYCKSLVKISAKDLKLLNSFFPLKKSVASEILFIDGPVIDDPINDVSSSWLFEQTLNFKPAYRYSYSKIDSPIFYDKWSSDSRIKSSDRIISVWQSDDLFSTCTGNEEYECGRSPREFSFALRSDELVGVWMSGGAACPYVYTLQADGSYLKEGEILRDLRRLALESVQSLVLSTLVKPGEELTVQLREEKREITYLDNVWLDLCGTRIQPRQCATSIAGIARPDYCDADNIYDEIKLGEFRDLFFGVPSSTTCKSVSLVAEGYYVPAERDIETENR